MKSQKLKHLQIVKLLPKVHQRQKFNHRQKVKLKPKVKFHWKNQLKWDFKKLQIAKKLKKIRL